MNPLPSADPTTPSPRHISAVWDKGCQAILVTNARRLGNIEIAAAIEAATGLRFSTATISRYRKLLGIAAPRRNTWAAPLLRARLLAAGKR